MTIASLFVSGVTLACVLLGLILPRFPDQQGRGAWNYAIFWIFLTGLPVGALVLALHNGYQPAPRPLAAGVAIALIVVLLLLAVHEILVTIQVRRAPPHE